MQQRLGADKLAVVLIDVDPEYFPKPDLYLPKAAAILMRHQLSWPNAIATKGFSDTVRAFNLSGYGNILVDARGIVRGVHLHDKELERRIEAVVEGTKTNKSKK